MSAASPSPAPGAPTTTPSSKARTPTWCAQTPRPRAPPRALRGGHGPVRPRTHLAVPRLPPSLPVRHRTGRPQGQGAADVSPRGCAHTARKAQVAARRRPRLPHRRRDHRSVERAPASAPSRTPPGSSTAPATTCSDASTAPCPPPRDRPCRLRVSYHLPITALALPGERSRGQLVENRDSDSPNDPLPSQSCVDTPVPPCWMPSNEDFDLPASLRYSPPFMLTFSLDNAGPVVHSRSCKGPDTAPGTAGRSASR